MKKIISIFAIFICLLGACVTEDIHTMLKNQEDHEIRIRAFEELCKTYNEQLVILQIIAETAQNKDYITHIRPTAEGYELTFALHGTYILKHGQKGPQGDSGQNGENGQDGQNGTDGKNGMNGTDGIPAPIVGIREENGVLYWTTTWENTTDWLLTPEGNRIKVNGSAGQDGNNGQDGPDGASPVPSLGIDSQGYWTLNGVRIKDVSGKEVKARGPDGLPGQDGEDAPPVTGGSENSIFANVIPYSPDSIVFELKDPTAKRFNLPVYQPLEFKFTSDIQADFIPGNSQTVNYLGTGIYEIQFLLPSRWHARANLLNSTITITAPANGEANASIGGIITILIFNGKGDCLTRELTVKMN